MIHSHSTLGRSWDVEINVSRRKDIKPQISRFLSDGCRRWPFSRIVMRADFQAIMGRLSLIQNAQSRELFEFSIHEFVANGNSLTGKWCIGCVAVGRRQVETRTQSFALVKGAGFLGPDSKEKKFLPKILPKSCQNSYKKYSWNGSKSEVGTCLLFKLGVGEDFREEFFSIESGPRNIAWSWDSFLYPFP